MKIIKLLNLLLVVGFHGLLHGSEKYSLEVQNARKVYELAAQQLGTPVRVRVVARGYGRGFEEITRNFYLAHESMPKTEFYEFDFGVSYQVGMYIHIVAYLPEAELVPAAVPVESCCLIS